MPLRKNREKRRQKKQLIISKIGQLNRKPVRANIPYTSVFDGLRPVRATGLNSFEVEVLTAQAQEG